MKKPTIIGQSSHLDGAPRCLNCDSLLDGATSVDADTKPTPGDLTVCLYCGHLMAFSDKLELRALTSEEIIAVAGDPTLLKIQKAAAMIRKKNT